MLLLLIGNRDGRAQRLDPRRLRSRSRSLVVRGDARAVGRFDPRRPTSSSSSACRGFPAFGIDYYVGVDGISLLLVVLTGFLTPIALLSSWESIERR